jgi:hypothetical protein
VGVPCALFQAGATVGDPDAALCHAVGISPSGAVLVRPDGVVAWRAVEAAAAVRETMARVFAAMLGRTVATVLTLLVLASAAAAAHHSFSAEYDANQPISLKGQIVRIDLVNPHAWLYLEVKDPDGTMVRWYVEMGAPNTLSRRGVTKTTLPVGETVTVDGYRARDGSTTVNGRQIQMADGRTLFTGSSSTAPGDQ